MANEYDLTGALMGYEDGELTEPAIVDLFAHLIKTGMAWDLQGHYGRTAAGFIKANVIDEFGDILIELDMD